MTRGRPGGGTRPTVATGGAACPSPSSGKNPFPQVKAKKGQLTISAPSRIRTCAHGSGGRFDLSL